MTSTQKNERRSGGDRREGKDRRDGPDRRHVESRQNARQLPDEFAQAAGAPQDRVAGLVNRYWSDRAEFSRKRLSAELLPVLEELETPGTPVTDDHRERCEQVVVGWVAGLDSGEN